jgi:hypothetical protein
MSRLQPSLYQVLNTGTLSRPDRVKALQAYGFSYDSSLSNANNATYFNPRSNELILNVKGTRPSSVRDIYTDIRLATGGLKSTDRYKESKAILEKARRLHKGASATITGYSLGGAIAGYIGGKNDKIITYNKGASIGQPIRQNETAYRSGGDLVSLADANANRMTTLKTYFNPLSAHRLSNIKDEKIFI